MDIKFTGLSRKLNAAVLAMVNNLLPMGYDVSDNAPDTYEKLVNHVNKTGRILVWSGASETTIYGDREVNYAFRAWHDYVHFTHQLGFSVLDEIKVKSSSVVTMLFNIISNVAALISLLTVNAAFTLSLSASIFAVRALILVFRVDAPPSDPV